MKHLKKLSIVIFLLINLVGYPQNNSIDSLSLSAVLQRVIETYPSLKKTENDLIGADAKMALTKTNYFPDINFSGNFTLLGPTTQLSLPGLGSFSLYPPYNYNLTVNINQMIYDFGKTTKSLSVDKQSKELIRFAAEQIKQKLSMATMMNFYTIGFLQKAISIKDDELKNLNDHLQYVQKKNETGSATKYDILTTKVRISAIENQKTDLLTSLKIQIAQLNSLMGKPQENSILVKNELQVNQHLPEIDSLCNVAFDKRSEIKLATQKEIITKSKLGVIKNQNNPSLNAFASGGIKNGYFNNKFEDIGKLNYVIGVGVKMPVFDANRTKYLKIQNSAELEGNQQETELARRNIINEVIECRANAESALKKVKQSELQVKQATEAYSLSNVNYNAGVITNLDLLDSYTALSESQLALFKTKIDYSLSLLKLKLSIGDLIY